MKLIEKNINKFLSILIIFFPILIILGPFLMNLFSIIFSIYALINFKQLYQNNLLNKKLIFIFSSFVFFIFPFESIDFFNSFEKYAAFSRFILMFFGLIIFFSNNDNNKFFFYIYKFYLITLIIIIFDVSIENIYGSNILGYSSNYEGRISSFTNDELIIGYIFSFILLSILGYLRNDITKDIYFLLFLIICLSISFCIGERSNFIKLFILLTLFYFLTFKSQNPKKILSSLLILTIASLVFIKFTINTAQGKKFYKPVTNIVLNDNLSTKKIKDQLYKTKHFAHYLTAYNIFLNHKLFGVGINNFYKESKKNIYSNDSLIFDNSRSSTHPHQIYFEILSEVGLAGLVYFFFVIIYPITISIKSLIKKKNYLILNHLFLHIFFILPILPSGSIFGTVYGVPFWFNLSILIYLSKKIEKEPNYKLNFFNKRIKT